MLFVNEIQNLYFLNKGAESYFNVREMNWYSSAYYLQSRILKEITGKYLWLPIIKNAIGVDNLTFMLICIN